MPLFSTENHDLHYITRGNPNRPPLLLLHGFLGSHQDFMPLVTTLSEHFYCIVPDLPGHGRTRSQPNSYTFPKIAKSLLALLRHLHIEKTHLLGYSMGGRLALYLACEFPDSFLRVVLESASPGLKTAEERAERQRSDEAIAHRLTTTPLPTFLSQWYSNPLFASLHQHPDQYAAMLQRRKSNSSVELAKALRGSGTGQQPSLWGSLPQLSGPLLLMVGALDHKFVATNREMLTVRGRQQVELEIIEKCGHNIHLESSIVYALTVLLFLSEQRCSKL